MPQQVNIAGIGVSQRHQQAVTADLQLTRFDTGKLLILSGAAGGVTASLPAIGTVEPGFFLTVQCASNHSHSVNGGAALIQGTTEIGQPAVNGTTIQALNGAPTLLGVGASLATGARLEIFCDGTFWYVQGGNDWTTS